MWVYSYWCVTFIYILVLSRSIDIYRQNLDNGLFGNITINLKSKKYRPCLDQRHLDIRRRLRSPRVATRVGFRRGSSVQFIQMCKQTNLNEVILTFLSWDEC